MIRVSQTFDFRHGVDVVAHNHEIRTPGFILSLGQQWGGMFDDYVETMSERSRKWAVLHITLRGHVRLEGCNTASEHASGTVFFGYGMGSVGLRSAPLSLACEGLTIAVLAPENLESKLCYVDRAPPELLRLAYRLAEHLQKLDEDEGLLVLVLRQFLASLNAWGVAAFPAEVVMESLARPTSAEDQRLAHVLSNAMTRLDQNPTLTDLANRMGLGERQTNRRMQALLETYYASHASWASYVAASRIGAAITISSHPDANLETIAKLAGYRRTTSLCHAFADAGLRSPAAVGKALRSGDGLRALK